MKKTAWLLPLFFLTNYVFGVNDTLKIKNRLSISVDPFVLIQSNKGFMSEFFVRYEWNNLIGVKLGFGYMDKRVDSVYYNVRKYQSAGGFYKLGINFIPKISKSTRFIAGVNCVQSFYKEKGLIEIKSSIWNTKSKIPYTIDDCSMTAIEYEIGFQFHFKNKHISLSPVVKIRKFLQPNNPSADQMFSGNAGNTYQSFFIPGLGFPYKGNVMSNIGFSLNLIYTFDLKPEPANW